VWIVGPLNGPSSLSPYFMIPSLLFFSFLLSIYACPLFVLCPLCSFMCLLVFRLFWVSSLAYPNLLGQKTMLLLLLLLLLLLSIYACISHRLEKRLETPRLA
jgi:hypothetical protein